MPVLNLKTMKVEGKGFKEKAKQVGRTVKAKASEAWQWSMEHPQEAVAIVTGLGILIGGVTKLGKGALKMHTLKMERFNKERYIYDHSMKAYLKLKRPIRNNDVVAINNLRAKTGMKLSEALAKLGLLE